MATAGSSSSVTKRVPDGQCLSGRPNGGVGSRPADTKGNGQCLFPRGVRGSISTEPIVNVTG